MSLFHGRSKGPDPYLDWKVRIFTVAAVLGLGGMYFEERWMGVGAIGLLASAMALRFLPGARRMSEPGADEGSTEEPSDHDRTEGREERTEER